MPIIMHSTTIWSWLQAFSRVRLEYKEILSDWRSDLRKIAYDIKVVNVKHYAGEGIACSIDMEGRTTRIMKAVTSNT